MVIKKAMAIMLSVAMFSVSAIPAYAADIPDGQTSIVQINAEAAAFKVAIPTVLPVHVASDGTVTVSNDAQIKNNSIGPIRVTNIDINEKGGWSKATTLDLSSFDTSNVTDMSYMFYGSMANAIDLSSFNTSNVTEMYRMFTSSRATTLNLSSFDTSSITLPSGVSSMFSYNKATTGYARTQADADNFNSYSSGRSSALTFVVK